MMSQDDGGWDDAGFDGGSPEHDWNGSAAGSGAGPTGGGPPWTNPRALAVAGAAVLVIVVVLVVVLVTRGGSSNPQPTQAAQGSPTPSSNSPSAPATSPDPTISTPPPATSHPRTTHSAASETLATFDQRADQICSKYVPKITSAIARRDPKDIGKYLGDELGDLSSLRTPDDNSDAVRQWEDNLSTTEEKLEVDDIPHYVADRKATAEVATQLGLHSCKRALPKPPGS